MLRRTPLNLKMSYSFEELSPKHSTLKQKAERVQKESYCSLWILQIKQGELSLQRETDSSGSATAYL